MQKLLAQLDVFGQITPPTGGVFDQGPTGLGTLLSIIIKTMIVVAGIYAVFNFILAGYAYISGSGDPKQIQYATSKIWQSIIGLVVVAGAIAIGAVVSLIIFGDASYILRLQIFTP